MAGCSPVFAVDSWDIAAATYKDNFDSTNVICSPIEKVNPRENHQRIQLLLTSPECTSHSVAKGAAKRSEVSRRTALTSLLWIEGLKPRWIIMENVPQLMRWSRYRQLLDGLTNLGYGFRETVINSHDFGVPQSRRRLFITCEIGAIPGPVKIPQGRKRRVARDILEPKGTYPTTPLFSQRRAAATLERVETAFSALGTKEPFLLVYYGSDGSGGWQTLDEPLRTVTTLDRFALVGPSRRRHHIRMLQPVELARAMGLPKYHLMQYGTRRDRVKLCGNGICAPVMKQVIKSIIPERLLNS